MFSAPSSSALPNIFMKGALLFVVSERFMVEFGFSEISKLPRTMSCAWSEMFSSVLWVLLIIRSSVVSLVPRFWRFNVAVGFRGCVLVDISFSAIFLLLLGLLPPDLL